jgi:hypothetical protein
MLNNNGNKQMNQAEKARFQHNMNTFGMSHEELEQLIFANENRLPMFAAGILSDIQELLDSAPDSKTLRDQIRKQLNVAKYALFTEAA